MPLEMLMKEYIYFFIKSKRKAFFPSFSGQWRWLELMQAGFVARRPGLGSQLCLRGP